MLLEPITLAAAFRWLRIQDTNAASNQPMRSENGKVWLLFNGEIYNHLELRSELSRDGVQFHTVSDTEVVLAAYIRWGVECFTRFTGMWALAVVD